MTTRCDDKLGFIMLRTLWEELEDIGIFRNEMDSAVDFSEPLFYDWHKRQRLALCKNRREVWHYLLALFVFFRELDLILWKASDKLNIENFAAFFSLNIQGNKKGTLLSLCVYIGGWTRQRRWRSLIRFSFGSSDCQCDWIGNMVLPKNMNLDTDNIPCYFIFGYPSKYKEAHLHDKPHRHNTRYTVDWFWLL